MVRSLPLCGVKVHSWLSWWLQPHYSPGLISFFPFHAQMADDNDIQLNLSPSQVEYDTC